MTVTKNNLVLASLACLFGMQAVLLLAPVLGLFPPLTAGVERLLPEVAHDVLPKWDIVLFGIFILTAGLGQVLVSTLWKDGLKQPDWWRRSLKYLYVEAAITFLLMSAAYKLIIYDNSPLLAQRAFIVLAAVAVLIKIFWRELNVMAAQAAKHVATKRLPTPCADLLSLTVIFVLIYVPNPERMLAQMFIGEQFHHFDFFIMSPGWAYLNNQLPYVNTISQYGVGVVAILAHVSQFAGGFDYLPLLKMIMVFGIGYYFLVYGFMRWWLKSIPLALAAVVVAFRLQMFHYGVSPLSWTYPSTTPLRFGLDIVWMGFLLAHLRTSRPVFLVLAALYSGAAVFYMTATGACVLLTFYFYLAVLIIIPHLRSQFFATRSQQIFIGVCALLSVASAFVLFWMTLGGHVWEKTFWHNMTEYLVFFAHGHAGGVLPIYESLKYRQFWASFMGFVLPLTYLASLFIVGTQVYLKKFRLEYIITAVIAVYGLANYQYYVVRSAVTSYYMNALPFVLIVAFWMFIWAKQLNTASQRRVIWGALALGLYALTTNHNYISYPNMLNFSKNPMVDITVAQRYPNRQGYFNHMVKYIKEEDKLPVNSLDNTVEDIRTEDSFSSDRELTQYFTEEFDFSVDAKLIRSFTKEGRRVPVLSSFETKILMQAQRPPFFYHLPLITSQPMRLRMYPSDAAHSPHFLQETLGQLDKEKPEYVFMERIFMQVTPASIVENNPNITAIAQYIREGYTPVQEGQYLVAMKRNPD